MNLVTKAATSFILNELFKRFPTLRGFYRPDKSPGAKRTDPNWINHARDGRIAIQFMRDDGIAVRLDIVVFMGKIVIAYYERNMGIKRARNRFVTIAMQNNDDEYEWSMSKKEEVTLDLANPNSLYKAVDTIISILQKYHELNSSLDNFGT